MRRKAGGLKIKRLFIVGLMVVGAFGLMPAPAHADCLGDDVPTPVSDLTTIDEKYLDNTCSGCGWIMIAGDYIPLFPC